MSLCVSYASVGHTRVKRARGRSITPRLRRYRRGGGGRREGGREERERELELSIATHSSPRRVPASVEISVTQHPPNAELEAMGLMSPEALLYEKIRHRVCATKMQFTNFKSLRR